MLAKVGVWVWTKRCPPVPSTDVWAAVLGGLPVEVFGAADPSWDAALVTVSRCEKYGCRSGSTPDTLGKMCVYDAWKFESPSSWYPRYNISNAVWRKDPPLVKAVEARMAELSRVVRQFNAENGEMVRSLWIDASILGDWNASSLADQKLAIRMVGEQLAHLL